MTPVGRLPEEQCLVDALALLHHEKIGQQYERTEAAAAVLGAQVALPVGVPIWAHLSPDSRELQARAYQGEPLTVHALEPAGASFLVHQDGMAHVRRGPALTLRLTDGDAAQLLVVFSGDVPAVGQ
jgi:hypothetical protein